MKDSTIYYSVGPLLYSPANNETIVSSIVEERFGTYVSLALCLEDTIRDDRVEEAEQILLHSLHTLYELQQHDTFYMPKLFIRVRSPKQIGTLLSSLSDARELVTGFIFPKFDLDNADSYLSALEEANRQYTNTFYCMPILESASLLHLGTRNMILYGIKERLDSIAPLILNIRVGGNDLCHVYGFRRSVRQTIYDIQPIGNLFSDIVTVFGTDYVISGPVWEYYNGEGWEEGLNRELERDLANGFLGKTVIHPNQIPAVLEACKVNRMDYEDAKSILGWDDSYKSLVSGNATSERMNEYKTHFHWARRILLLAEVYGIKEEKEAPTLLV